MFELPDAEWKAIDPGGFLTYRVRRGGLRKTHHFHRYYRW